MARICAVCGKKPQVGFRVSHAHNRNKRRWLPNLQSIRALHNGSVRRMRVCTQCIRSGKVEKVPYNHSGQKAGGASASSG